MTNTAYDDQPGTAIFHAYGTRFNYLTSSDQSIAWVVTGWDQQSHGADPNNNTAGRCDDDCSIPGGGAHAREMIATGSGFHTYKIPRRENEEGDSDEKGGGKQSN